MSLKRLPYILLTLVLVMGLGLRLYRLGDAPAGFFCDEAATGYNAYTLLTHGTDEFGKPWPLFFQSFGIWRAPIPFYAAVPSIWLFGLTEFASRFPSAIIGTLTILVVFLLSRELTRSTLLALLSALFIAVAPWHIHFSRFAEANIYWPFFLTLSVWIFIRGLNRASTTWIAASGICFGLSLYTYFPAYLLSPLFAVGLIGIYWRALAPHRSAVLLGGIVFCIVALPLIAGLGSGTTTARLKMTSLSSTEKTPRQLAQGIVTTYADHFSPSFLFFKGDIGYKTHFITRYSVRGLGQLYLFQWPLILLGLWIAYKRFPQLFRVCIWWLILYPIGSSVVPFADGGGPFATRSIMGVIPFQLLSAAGLYGIYTWIKHQGAKYAILLISMAVLVASVSWYIQLYFFAYPLYSSDFWGWQYGARPVIAYFLTHKDAYDELYLTDAFNSPDSFISFYDPANVCESKCHIGTWNRWREHTKQLFAVTPANLDSLMNEGFSFSTKETVWYPNGQPAFYIGEIQKENQ